MIPKEIFLKHGVTESTEPRGDITRKILLVDWDRKHIFVVIDIQQVLVDELEHDLDGFREFIGKIVSLGDILFDIVQLRFGQLDFFAVVDRFTHL